IAEPEPSVAEDDLQGSGPAVAQEGEVARVAGDADHGRVDLVEGPALVGAGVAGQGPRAQPAGRDRAPRPTPAEGVEDLADRAAREIIGGRLAPQRRREVLLAV